MIALYAFWVLGEWKTTFAVLLFDKFDCKFAYRLFGSDGTTKIFTFLYANLRWYIHLSFIFVAVESQYSMLLGWMILSSILTTKCYYYYYPGKSNEQTLHEETTYSCWHAGANNKQTSPRTTAPIFQSQTVWSVAALKFWKTVPIVNFWRYPPKTLVIWYHVTSWETYADPLGWYQKILMISPEFVAGIVINFCWNFDQSILMISSDRSDNSHKLLMIILMKSLESYDETWYPQKTVAICAENIGSVFWVQNILGLCSWCVATTTDPWLACFNYISELFDGYPKILETPQNLLRKPQNSRRNLQIFLRHR